MGSNVLVELQGVTKRYKMGKSHVDALREVDLKISEGESVSIMGPSGSGKSTLMHLIGCLDVPSTGHYFLGGYDVASLSDNALSMIRAKNIGFVFQSFNLISQLNVYENVEVPFLYGMANPENARESILKAVDRVGLSHRLHHLPSELSGGEMQRVAIARALAIQPLIILADEPTGNLDTETGATILKLFQQLNAQGVTLILVTHDSYVASHFSRTIRMRDGQIVDGGKGDS
jgi:putative ABC transport system ATP-binding protein